MTNIEISGISAGLGAMSLTKQLRRINEMGGKDKMKFMQNAMKSAKTQGLDPKEALKSLKGKV